MSDDGFIPEHGGFKKLKSYRKSVVVYDATLAFCRRFYRGNHRQVDQMEQAARSGKQNIVEGSLASATSKKTEVHLTNVAKASLGELLEDYEDFLRTRGLPLWERDHPEARRITRRARADSEETYDAHRAAVETGTPEVAANTVRHLTLQAIYLLGRQIKRLEADFLQEGGIRERMTAARLRARAAPSSSESSPSSRSPEPPSPQCPACGESMVRRIARRGPNADTPFWGCSKYPDCRGTLPMREDRGDGEDREDTGKALLVCSSLPLGLIRRPVRVIPVSLEEFRRVARSRRIIAFPGQGGVLSAESLPGLSSLCAAEYSEAGFSADDLPMLKDIVFTECWILFPQWAEEASEKTMTGQILKIQWENS